jgi:hypothetical protein
MGFVCLLGLNACADRNSRPYITYTDPSVPLEQTAVFAPMASKADETPYAVDGWGGHAWLLSVDGKEVHRSAVRLTPGTHTFLIRYVSNSTAFGTAPLTIEGMKPQHVYRVAVRRGSAKFAVTPIDMGAGTVAGVSTSLQGVNYMFTAFSSDSPASAR